jgi:hypothetical protein
MIKLRRMRMAGHMGCMPKREKYTVVGRKA